MQTQTKKNLISILIAILLVSVLGGIFSSHVAPVKAEDIDYVNRFYQDLTVDDEGYYENVDEEKIYKIHCPETDGSGEYPYVTVISLINTDGGFIFFEKGVAYNYFTYGRENQGSAGIEVCSDYYEILYYDETNENVYIRLKNLDQLAEGNPVIMYGEMVDTVQYTYIKNESVSAEDVTIQTLYNDEGSAENTIFAFDIKFSLSLDKVYSVESLKLTIEGSEGYTFDQDILKQGDGILDGDMFIYNATAYTSLECVDEVVTVNAVITTFAGESVTVSSSSFSLLSIWRGAIEGDTVGENVTAEQLALMKKLVDATTNGFNVRVVSSEFSPITTGERIPLALSYIILRFEAKTFSTFTLQDIFNDEVYTLKIEYINEGLNINRNGRLFSGVPSSINSILTSVKDGFIYIGFVDDAWGWMPGGCVWLSSGEGVSVNINVIADSDVLEAEILRLQTRISELETQCSELQNQLASKNAEISAKESEIARLDLELENANAEIERLNGVIDALEAEIDALEKELADVKENNTAKDAEITRLESEIADLQKQLEEANEKIASLESAQTVNVANINALTSEVETLREEKKKLQSEYDALVQQSEGDSVELASLLRQRNETIKKQQERIDELEKENEELKKNQTNKNEVSFGCGGSSGTPGAGVGGDGTALLMAPLFGGTLLFMLMRSKRGKEEE